MPKKKTENTEEVKKKISAKDMVYAEIDDEITTLVGRIRRSSNEELYLVIPQKASVFQSIVNLKILKQMAEDLGKKIFVITMDKHGRKLSEEAGLSLIEKVEGIESAPRIIAPSLSKTSLKKEKNPEIKKVEKISIAEIIERDRKSETEKLPIKERARRAQKALRDKGEELNLTTPNKKMFAGIFLGAIVLFLGVMFITLPSATVYVSPEKNIIEKTSNLIFTDATINPAEVDSNSPRIIPTYPVSTIFEKTYKFPATDKIFTGSTADGYLNIYNETAQPWILIGGTRFQTDDGIVFRIKNDIVVPGATSEIDENDEGKLLPGELNVKVVADEVDSTNDVIGDRGNIAKDTTLRIPGLSQYNQQFIYGVASEDFSGGVTDYYTIVSEDDLNASRDFALLDIEASAKEELRKYIKERNQGGRNLELFEDDGSFTKEVLEVNVPMELSGTATDEFEVTAKMSISGNAYDKSILLSTLERELSSAVHPDKILEQVNKDGVTLKILPNTRDENDGKITVVAVIQGVEAWNLDESTTVGKNMVDKIRTHIMSKSEYDALNYVKNLREVKEATISIWPFWSPSLPGLASQISVETGE